MSDNTIIVDVVAVEASTLVVDVVAPPPVALVIDVIAPPPVVAVVEIANWGSVPVGYPQLPAELRTLPISFPFADKPSPGAEINVPMAFTLTVPSGLAGTVVYDEVPPLANASFEVNRISGGVVTALGVVMVTPVSNTSCILMGNGGTLAVGDVLQIVAPIQDPDLTNVGITVLAERV